MLRPQACQGFELITTRDDLAAVLHALARGGAVELQTFQRRAAPWVIAGAEPAIERFRGLAKRHRPYWPAPRGAAGRLRLNDPGATLTARLLQVQGWCDAADPLIVRIEGLARERQALADLARLLQAAPALVSDTAVLAASGRVWVEARLYAVPVSSLQSAWPLGVLVQTFAADDEAFVFVAGARDAMPAVEQHFEACKARRIVWPRDLQGSPAQAAQEVAQRHQALEGRAAALEAELQALSGHFDLEAALSEIEVVEWLVRHGGELAAGERLAWVSGWTTAADERELCAPLERLALPCVVQLTLPPAGSVPPSRLDNPRWIRSFEAFARLLGQPGPDEADPSAWVALIAPLLFGFMFGDVGQGAVLCAAGWLLRKHGPMLALLIPGGVTAMVFGLLFGSVFAREDLLPALWLHPLHEPVTLLAAAIGLGAVILLGGLLLNAVQAFWRHEAPRWWARDAGLVLAYLGLLAAPWHTGAFGLAAAGALWSAAGAMATANEARIAALATGLAQFIEQAVQLVVNTVSFARVGAFALAHAGLSVAITGVAQASGEIGYWVVLVLGNALILVLEGLVVGIQTTRLLLFEFFVRFLKGSGRPFKPLQPPLMQQPTLRSL